MDDIAPPRCDPGPHRAHAWAGALLALLALAAGGVTAGNVTEPSNVEVSLFALPTTHDHIGRVIVPVSINGRGPFRFIVDTGANHSTISPQLVHTLGLKIDTESSIVLEGITGSARVSYVSVERLQAGDLMIQDTTLPVVWAPVMAGADGILGAAGLSDKSLLIDFRRNRVALASRLDSQARADTTKVHAMRVAGGLMVVEARVGGVRVEAVLDTGSERTLGNVALRDALKVRGRSGRGFVAQLTSVYGATTEVEPGEIQAAPLIAIESLRITDVAVVFGEFHIFKVWEMEDRPAMILGMDVLGTVASLNIDFRNREVYFGTQAHGQGSLEMMRGILSDQAQKR